VSQVKRTIKYSQLDQCGLVVDTVYEAGDSGLPGDDPINRILRCGQKGGLRCRGNIEANDIDLSVLTLNLSDPYWSDSIDKKLGQLTFYGDNRRAGLSITNSSQKVNIFLTNIFKAFHTGQRHLIPPVFIFSEMNEGLDTKFCGLAVPGASNLNDRQDFINILKTINGRKFQIYKSTFTILNIPNISRDWIRDLTEGKTPFGSNAPEVWLHWIKTRRYIPIISS